MTKPCNFPERKNARRKTALRHFKVLPLAEGHDGADTGAYAKYLERKETEKKALEKKIHQEPMTAVFTKKNRESRAPRRATAFGK